MIIWQDSGLLVRIESFVGRDFAHLEAATWTRAAYRQLKAAIPILRLARTRPVRAVVDPSRVGLARLCERLGGRRAGFDRPVKGGGVQRTYIWECPGHAAVH